MSRVEIYTFEDNRGGEWLYVTRDPVEANNYGMRHGLRVIANVYAFTNSELVADYTPQPKEKEEKGA